MNSLCKLVKAIVLMLLSLSSLSNASLVGDEICFTAMQGSVPSACDTIIVRDPTPADPQPVDIDLRAESIHFDCLSTTS